MLVTDDSHERSSPERGTTASIEMPPIKGEILVSAGTSLPDLAAMLGQSRLRLTADLAELGIASVPNQSLSFDLASRLARKYGFLARMLP